MATIKSNVINNKIGTEENITNFNSNLKLVFSSYYAEQYNNLRSFQLIEDNINFNYSTEDFLNKCEMNEKNKELLKSRGYKLTTEEYYRNIDYNGVYKINTNLTSVDYNRQDIEITFFDGGYTNGLKYIFEDNIIVFYDEKKSAVMFELSFEKDITIYDFTVYENEMIHIYIKYKGDFYIIHTSSAHEFANYLTPFEKIECFYKIKISNDDLGEIISFKGNKYVFCDKDLNLTEIELAKHYYMESDDKKYYYFTQDKQFLDLENISIETNIQIEHLFLYDLLSIFGLSNFTYSNGNKRLSSKNVHEKNQLFKFKFDDTANGFVNFYNHENINKSYRIDINENDFLKVYGNLLFDNMETGEYRLIIDSKGNSKNSISNNLLLRCRLQKKDINDNFSNIKDITYDIFSNRVYFSNLCIEVNGVFTKPISFSYNFNITEIPELELIKDFYNFDIVLNDNDITIESKILNNSIVKNNNKLKNPIKIDNSIKGNEIVLDSFYVEDKGDVEKNDVSFTFSELLFDQLPITSDTNYNIAIKNEFENEVKFEAVTVEEDLFSIRRTKFDLLIN
jgi:hypothetical protein